MVSQADFDDLQLLFYIVGGVLIGVTFILVIGVIALFIRVHKVSSNLKKHQNHITAGLKPMPIAKALNPNEELAKRYTMTGEDNKSYRTSPTLDSKNPLSRPISLKRFDISNQPSPKSKNEYSNAHGLMRPPPPQKRDRNASADGMHFAEDRLHDDLYY